MVNIHPGEHFFIINNFGLLLMELLSKDEARKNGTGVFDRILLIPKARCELHPPENTVSKRLRFKC